jgi:hypothetical protein
MQKDISWNMTLVINCCFKLTVDNYKLTLLKTIHLVLHNIRYGCATVFCLGLKSLEILLSIATGLPTGQAGLSPWQLNTVNKWVSCPIAWQAGSPTIDCRTAAHTQLLNKSEIDISNLSIAFCQLNSLNQ